MIGFLFNYSIIKLEIFQELKVTFSVVENLLFSL